MNLWEPNESRAELEIERGSQGIAIKVFSCSDTVSITLTKEGELKVE